MVDKNELIKEIEKTKQDNYLIVVEGKKDKTALEKIGFHNIFVLNENGKSILVRIEEIIKRKEECVILTDFDKKGKKLYNLIKSQFILNGVKMNNRLRNMLLKSHLSHIEGIFTFLNNFYPR